MAARLTIDIEDIRDDWRVDLAFYALWGLYNNNHPRLQIIDTRYQKVVRKGGEKIMAYDVTALTTAIAEGKVDEVSARQLIADYYDWEIKVAQLLTPTSEGVATPPVESVADATPNETPAESPADTVDLTQSESGQPETQV